MNRETDIYIIINIFLMKIIIASALLIAGTVVQAQYLNMTGATFNEYMDCTSCIRSGYDYCLYTNATSNVTATYW